MNELIAKKIDKEANRYIQNWAEEKIAVENGRWGPFIRFQKKMLKMGLKPDETKYTAEELATIPLDDIKKMIEVQVPNAFAKKGAGKKTAAKKATAAKKTATAKKAAPKKAAKKK
jgi:DNA topoisomerase I